MNHFLLQHMTRMYRAFDGDLVEALVLGAIAYSNLDGGSAPAADGEPRRTASIEQFEARFRSESAELSPAHAKSIADRTGIPRETVRRKVAALMAKGWVVQDEAAGLRLTRIPEAHFRTASEQTLREFLEVAAEVGAGVPGEIPELESAPHNAEMGASEMPGRANTERPSRGCGDSPRNPASDPRASRSLPRAATGPLPCATTSSRDHED